MGSTSFLTLCFFFFLSSPASSPNHSPSTPSTPPPLIHRFGLSGWRRFFPPALHAGAILRGADWSFGAVAIFSWGLRHEAKSVWKIRDCLESQVRLIIVRGSLKLIITPNLALGAVKSCSVLSKQGHGRIINSPARTNYITVCSFARHCQPCWREIPPRSTSFSPGDG